MSEGKAVAAIEFGKEVCNHFWGHLTTFLILFSICSFMKKLGIDTCCPFAP